MKVSIIIPAYNEESVIEKNMKLLSKWCEDNLGDYEIVIVNDGSRDLTSKIICEKLNAPCFKDAGYEDNRGKGGALKQGVKAASGDIIVTTDCDLAYGCEVIADAVKLMSESKSELLIGSRTLAKDGFAGYPFIRKLASKIYFRLLSVYAGLSVSDSQCGFKCYKKEAAKTLFSELETTGFAFDLEILLRSKKHGYNIAQMPVSIKNHGNSKVNVIRDCTRMLADVRRIKRLCVKGSNTQGENK
ncbi:MAG: glycosyltransferase [Clostridia bacterium]|nr:glycosyltransferase [Clostridia bacterium]